MKVLKFGGTSVGSEKGLSQVKKIVESCSEDVIVVVSALGGITDQLLLTARLAAAGDEAYMPQCTAMIARHNELVEKIVLPENRPGVQNRLDELLDERGREFFDENWRRNDLIRFGEYERDWGFKNIVNPAAKTKLTNRIFPIPQGILDTNTNWNQNEGY